MLALFDYSRLRRYLVPTGLAFVLLVSVLLNTFIALQPASADQSPVDYSGYLETAKQRSVAEGMKVCIRYTNGFMQPGLFDSGKLDSNQVADGTWGASTDWWVGRMVDVSRLVDPQDGVYNCREIATAAKNMFGYTSYTEMFCSLGGLWEGSQNQSCMQDFAKGYTEKRWYIPREQASSTVDILSKKIGKDLSARNSTLNYSLGMHLLSIKDGGCSAAWKGVDSAVNDDIKYNTAKYFKTKVVLADGSTSFGYFELPDSKAEIKVFPVQASSPWGFSSMSCAGLINWVSENADGAAASVKQQVKDTTNTSVVQKLVELCKSKGNDETTCRSRVGASVQKCESKLPSSGNISDSNEYIKCLSENLGFDEKEVKDALEGIAVFTVPGASQDNNSNEIKCAIQEVGWVICPLTNFLAKVADSAFGIISEYFLSIDPRLINGDSSVFKAWELMRNIANVIFIIFFIVVVYSQITGVGVSNYGIKKLLPKLLIAALLVNLSLFICQLAVDLSNILGYSLKAALGDLGVQMGQNTTVELSANNTGEGREWVVIVASILAGAGGMLALSTVIGALMAAVIILLTIALLLIARKAMIILLVILAPLAFVALLLPNTEKMFTRWRSIFTAMLMVFPIIGLLFGAGLLAGQVISAAAGQNSTMQVVGEVVKVLPLFFVWGILRKSMDAITAVSGAINTFGDRAKGSASSMGEKAIEGTRWGQMRDFYKQKMATNRALTRAGQYSGKNPLRALGSRVNRRLNQIDPSGRQMAASGVMIARKEANEKVDQQEALIRNSVRDISNLPDEAARQLMDATKSGDIAQARAAQRILMNSGAPGMSQLHDTLHKLESDGHLARDGAVSQAIRQDIQNAGIKGKDAVLDAWAYKQGSNIGSLETDSKTFSGLTASEIASQHVNNLRGSAAGAISANMANEILGNAETKRLLSQDKIDYFEDILTSPTPPGPNSHNNGVRNRKTPMARNGSQTPYDPF